jgi:hypothetical protein
MALRGAEGAEEHLVGAVQGVLFMPVSPGIDKIQSQRILSCNSPPRGSTVKLSSGAALTVADRARVIRNAQTYHLSYKESIKSKVGVSKNTSNGSRKKRQVE